MSGPGQKRAARLLGGVWPSRRRTRRAWSTIATWTISGLIGGPSLGLEDPRDGRWVGGDRPRGRRPSRWRKRRVRPAARPGRLVERGRVGLVGVNDRATSWITVEHAIRRPRAQVSRSVDFFRDARRPARLVLRPRRCIRGAERLVDRLATVVEPLAGARLMAGQGVGGQERQGDRRCRCSR